MELGAAADMTHYDGFGALPAHLAARNGHVSAISVLLGAGFDISLQSRAGTVLHKARHQKGILKHLLEGGGGARIANV